MDSFLPDPRLTVTPLQALLGMGFLGLFQQQLPPWAWGRRAPSCFHQSLPSSPPLEVQQADSSVTLLLTQGVQLKPSLARHSSIKRPSRATKRHRSRASTWRPAGDLQQAQHIAAQQELLRNTQAECFVLTGTSELKPKVKRSQTNSWT